MMRRMSLWLARVIATAPHSEARARSIVESTASAFSAAARPESSLIIFSIAPLTIPLESKSIDPKEAFNPYCFSDHYNLCGITYLQCICAL